MRSRNTSGQLDTFSLLRLRKAALLSHWLPGLDLVVHQRQRPVVRCSVAPVTHDMSATTLDLHPCQFRRLVLSLGDAGLVGLQPLDPTEELEIEYLTNDRTQLGPHGLVRATIDDTTKVLGFACAIELDLADDVDQRRRDHSGPAPLDVHFDHDDELGVTLVHRAFEAGAGLQERRVFDVLLDLASIYGAEEISANAPLA